MARQTDRGHPDEVELLAGIHGEPSGVALHLASCPTCQQRRDLLMTEELRLASLLSVIDHRLPERSFEGVLRARRRHGVHHSVIAAGLTIICAAAAAALPSSPIHEWLWGPRVGVHQVSGPSSIPEPAPFVTPKASPGGISIPAPRSLLVEFSAPQDSGVVEITRDGVNDVELRSSGGRVAYEVADEKISVDNRVPATTYQLVVPMSLRQLDVLIAGHRVFSISGDSVTPSTSRSGGERYVVVLRSGETHLP